MARHTKLAVSAFGYLQKHPAKPQRRDIANDQTIHACAAITGLARFDADPFESSIGSFSVRDQLSLMVIYARSCSS
jgi:hypothetical protein